METNQNTFASAFKYSAIGMAVVSPQGHWLEVNDAICHMIGYSREELLQLKFQDITYPDDLDIDLKFVAGMLKKEIESYSLEKRYISKNGKIVWVLLTVSLVWNEDDTPRFFISQIVDITKIKGLADELRRKNMELEATRDSLIAKVSQLEEFSYIVAHNIRGPVGNLVMLSEILKNGEQDQPFTQKEAINMVHEVSSSLMDSLQTLMSIAQVQLNKHIAYDECNVEAIIEQINSQFAGTIFEKNGSIERNLAIKTISYPKAYLENIFHNLISNALKYSRPQVPPCIVISTLMKGNRILISVKDNGLGIDLTKYSDRIFKLNQYFHSGYDSKGVGLFLIKTQIESLNGTIDIQSTVNEGTEFIVTI